MASLVPLPGRIRFGAFELDAANEELRKDGHLIRLQPQAIRVLILLTENAGQVVLRDEIRDCLWGQDTFVDFERGINFCVNQIRAALGDDADAPRYVETVPRRGYRFIASVAADVAREPASTAAVVSITTVLPRESSESKGVTEGSHRPSARLSRLGTSLIFSTIAVIAVGVLLLILHFRRASPLPLDIRQMTTAGNVWSATISRDGRYLAYSTAEGEGKLALWLQQVPTPAGIQLLPPTRHGDIVPSFSPDSSLLYFAQFEPGIAEGELYVMPILGGAPRKLYSGVISAAGVSPDGKWLAFLRANPGAESDSRARELVIGAADGSALRTIARGQWALESNVREFRPDWSPGGSLVAVPTVDTNGANHLGIFPASPGDQTQLLLGPGWDFLDQPVWLPDGRSMIIFGWESSQPHKQLYEVSYPGGGVRRISSGIDDYHNLSISGDGRFLAAVRRDELSSIWIAPYDDPDGGRPITPTPSHGGIVSLVWTRDRQIFYQGNTADGIGIHSMAADGSGSHLLPLRLMRSAFYSTCPDGTLIFCAIQDGRWRIWRSARDGSDAKFITRGEGEGAPECTPDGKWVVYVSLGEGRREVFKVPVDGGPAVRVSSKTLGRPIPSPDGRWLAALLVDPSQRDVEFSKLAILDFTTGALTKMIDFHPRWVGGVWHWTRDGKALIYPGLAGGVENLWLQPISGGPSRQFTHFTSEGVLWFDLSPDGSHIAITRFSRVRDAVLLSNLR